MKNFSRYINCVINNYVIKGVAKMNIGIIGGGRGGLAILNLLTGLSSVTVKWVADIQDDAPAVIKAKELGIEAVRDFVPKLNDPSLQMVIEVTGVEKARQLLNEHKKSELSVIDATSAKLLVTIVEQREKLFQQIHAEAETLLQHADSLNVSATQIRSGMQQLAEEAGKLAAAGDTLAHTSEQAAAEAEKTRNILKLIEEIAKKTNIIGLNAAIEAARVGQAGQGFTVVANEIRRLAESTSKSIKDISAITGNIVSYMDTIFNGVKEARASAQNQAASTQEVLAALEGLAKISAELKSQADFLTKLT